MHTRRASIATLQQPAHPMRCGRTIKTATASKACTHPRNTIRPVHGTSTTTAATLAATGRMYGAKQKATRDGPAVKKNSAPQRRARVFPAQPPSSRQQQPTRPPRELVQRCKVRRVGHLTTCMGTLHNNKNGHNHASAQADARHNQCGGCPPNVALRRAGSQASDPESTTKKCGATVQGSGTSRRPRPASTSHRAAAQRQQRQSGAPQRPRKPADCPTHAQAQTGRTAASPGGCSHPTPSAPYSFEQSIMPRTIAPCSSTPPPVAVAATSAHEVVARAALFWVPTSEPRWGHE